MMNNCNKGLSFYLFIAFDFVGELCCQSDTLFRFKIRNLFFCIEVLFSILQCAVETDWG